MSCSQCGKEERAFCWECADMDKRLAATRMRVGKLLEACEGMLSILEAGSARSGGWKGPFADQCRAAIAKARARDVEKDEP